jgi:hypothetical protein
VTLCGGLVGAWPDDVVLISWTDAVVPQAFAVFGAFLVVCLGWGAPSPTVTVAFGRWAPSSGCGAVSGYSWGRRSESWPRLTSSVEAR